MATQNKSRYGTLILLTGACWLLAANAKAFGEAAKWQMGDFWKIGVTLYSRGWALSSSNPSVEARKNIPTVLSRYIVEARVIGVEGVDNVSCWKVEYRTDGDVARGLEGQRYVTWIAQDDGSVKRVRRMASPTLKPANIWPQADGGIAVMPVATYGFPLEFVLPTTQEDLDPNGRREMPGLSIRVKEEPESKATRVELALKRGIDEFKIDQVWPEGAQWWGRHVKHYQGHLEIEASTVGPWLSGEFNRLYQEWRQLNDEHKSELADAKYAQMKSLGIAAIPSMIEKIRNGDLALIPTASELSGGRLKNDATQAEALEWWEANKGKWLAPFPPHEPDPPWHEPPRRGGIKR